MKKQDAYKVLEIAQTASQDEIKKAFRTLAAKLHPDKNPNDKDAESKFKEVNTAYQILTGAAKAEEDYTSFGQDYNGDIFNNYSVNNMYDEFLNNFYKSHVGKNVYETKYRSKISIQNIHTTIQLTFEESVFGGHRKLSIPIQVYCTKCGGDGFEHSVGNKCEKCDGKGYFTDVLTNENYRRTAKVQCIACSGTGKKRNICKECNGHCFKNQTNEIKLKIPSIGSETIKISVNGKGNKYTDSVCSNVIITLIPTIRRDKFKIDKFDVFSTEEIPLDILMYGGEIDVKGVDGEIEKLQIPPGTEPNSELHINHKGVRNINYSNNSGAHIVIVKMRYPHLTEELREAIQKAYKQPTTEENNGKTKESNVNSNNSNDNNNCNSNNEGTETTK